MEDLGRLQHSWDQSRSCLFCITRVHVWLLRFVAITSDEAHASNELEGNNLSEHIDLVATIGLGSLCPGTQSSLDRLFGQLFETLSSQGLQRWHWYQQSAMA